MNPDGACISDMSHWVQGGVLESSGVRKPGEEAWPCLKKAEDQDLDAWQVECTAPMCPGRHTNPLTIVLEKTLMKVV